MKKGVIWGLCLAFGIGAIVTGLFLLPDESAQNETDLPIEAVIEEQELFPETVVIEPDFPEGYDFDQDDDQGAVTRIVIENNSDDDREISSILSEKVIIGNQVVDQSASSHQ